MTTHKIAQVCWEKYLRPATTELPNGLLLQCTYMKDHAGPHSWEALQVSDRRTVDDEPGTDVEVLIENIASGHADPYLEAILAAAHGRKRALRNVQNPYGRKDCG